MWIESSSPLHLDTILTSGLSWEFGRWDPSDRCMRSHVWRSVVSLATVTWLLGFDALLASSSVIVLRMRPLLRSGSYLTRKCWIQIVRLLIMRVLELMELQIVGPLVFYHFGDLPLRTFMWFFFIFLLDGLKFSDLRSLLVLFFLLLVQLWLFLLSVKKVDALELLHTLLGHWFKWIIHIFSYSFSLLTKILDPMGRS